MKTLSTSILFLIFLPVLLTAQEMNSVVPMSEVVVTASKQSESKGNVTQKIDIISDSILSTIVFANNNLSEAVGRTPGTAARPLSRNDANWGTYGGIGPKYSTYMLQGLPIDAFVDPMVLDLSSIARIEVQRGPASVLYPNYLSQDFAGNQSPLAGTVNLILKDRFERPQTIASTTYGTYNTINNLFYHQNNTETVHYFAGASYERSDYTDYGMPNSWLNMKKVPEYSKTKLFSGVSFDLDENQHASVFVNKVFHTGDAGRIYRGFDNDYTLVNAGYSFTASEKVTVQSHFGLRRYDRIWQESNFGIIDTLVSNNGVEQNIIPMDVNVSIVHGERNLLVIGADYQHAAYSTWSDPLRGYRQFGNRSNSTQSGLYAQEEFRVDALTLRAGARYSFTKTMIDLIDGNRPGERSRTWSVLLWSGGVRYRVNSGTSFFANAGNSFIAPGLKSTGGTIALADKGVAGRNGQLPNPGLEPESGLGLDLGMEMTMIENVTFGIRLFRTDVNDAIIENVVSVNPSQSQSINAGNSHSTGAEVEISHQLTPAASWFANFTYAKTSIDHPSNADQDGTDIPFAPAMIANAGFDLSFDLGLRITPFVNYSSDFYDSNSRSGRKAFTQGTIVNLSVSQQIAKSEHASAVFMLNVTNLTDNQYEMPWQFRNTGRAITGGLKVLF
jgi:iron complex outermembrane receptor protein